MGTNYSLSLDDLCAFRVEAHESSDLDMVRDLDLLLLCQVEFDLRDDMRISVYAHGHWAGVGTWDRKAGRVIDCDADLGDDVWDALDRVVEAHVEAVDAGVES